MLNIQKNQYIGTQKQQGFTLIELMVVIVILGVLAALVVPNVMGNKERADTQKAVSDIVALENALDMYKLDNHRYPTTEQTLEALVTLPTINPLPANYRNDGYIKRLPPIPGATNTCWSVQVNMGLSMSFLPGLTVSPTPQMT